MGTGTCPECGQTVKLGQKKDIRDSREDEMDPNPPVGVGCCYGHRDGRRVCPGGGAWAVEF